MNLNNLLVREGIDPKRVLVFRHAPQYPRIRKALPWMAGKRPDLFNAYQQTQGERLGKAMQKLSGIGYIASFIGIQPGEALFAGLYSIGESKPLTCDAFWAIPAHLELETFGVTYSESTVIWFDLRLTDSDASWKGRLTVNWPGGEKSWWRYADRNEFTVQAMLEENAFDQSQV